MTPDVEPQDLPLHPLSDALGHGQVPDAPPLARDPPARGMLQGYLRLLRPPPLLRQGPGIAQQLRPVLSARQAVQEPTPDEVLQRVPLDGGPAVQVGDGDEGPLAPLDLDGRDGLLGEALTVAEADAERRTSGGVLHGEVSFGEVDVRREHPEPDPPRLVQE